MADSIDVLKAIAPEFSSEPDSTLETFLELAAQELDAPTWGKLYQQGAVYLAAHKLALRERGQSLGGLSAGNVSGSVESVNTGDLSVAFGSDGSFDGSVGESALAETKYGKQFLELQERLITTPVTTD